MPEPVYTRLKSDSQILEERIRSIRLVGFDFDGVFTDNHVYVFADGSEAVRCYRGDGIGLEKLKRLGIATVIISTEVNPIVEVRSKKLGTPYVQGCTDKRATLIDIAKEKGLTLQQVAFVGNDLNDRACLLEVGLPIVVQDAHPDVAALGLYRTKTSGGQGAVREVCDLFENVLAQASAR
ncbi:MAG TPA: HAD hydrolase family protein [Terriglobales bacterium]|nr:HAD hydrolase family protein [Terriglobales bacterium]